jgi:hypothetical protein
MRQARGEAWRKGRTESGEDNTRRSNGQQSEPKEDAERPKLLLLLPPLLRDAANASMHPLQKTCSQLVWTGSQGNEEQIEHTRSDKSVNTCSDRAVTANRAERDSDTH